MSVRYQSLVSAESMGTSGKRPNGTKFFSVSSSFQNNWQNVGLAPSRRPPTTGIPGFPIASNEELLNVMNLKTLFFVEIILMAFGV